MFKQEKIAKSLHNELTDYLSKKELNVKSKLEGAGVHWNSIYESEDAKISIYCCDLSYMRDHKENDEEFIVSFFLNDREISCGRSYNRKKVVESVAFWLLSREKSALYANFEYVDKGLRMIKELEEKWLAKYPELSNSCRVINSHGSGIIQFEINNGDRACWFTTTGENKELLIGFSIDHCTLFESVAKNEEVAEVFSRFLVKEEKLSSLSKEFNWIISNDLVQAYENGNGIEGEFIDSWNNITSFYKKINKEYTDDVLSFISDLRSKGFDKTLRAGQSLYTFILSKSRRHGLTENQKYLAFSFQKDKMLIRNNKNETMSFNKIELNSEVENLLNTLNQQPIE